MGAESGVFDLSCAVVPPPPGEIKEAENAVSGGSGVPQQPLGVADVPRVGQEAAD